MNKYSKFNAYRKVSKNSFSFSSNELSGDYLLFTELSDRLVCTCVIDFKEKFKLSLPINVTLKVAMDILNQTLEQVEQVEQMFA